LAPTLLISGVSHRFELHGQPLSVLDHISFRVALGEPSGCGKSTLLRLVAGRGFPSTGRVLVEGGAID
jgi:NitT/TauT family transport system ATP-binding protein